MSVRHPDAETVYRRLLLAYPRSWRARHGGELLSVLLQDRDARGTARPSVREGSALVVGGMRARAAAADLVPSIQLLERVSLLALVSGTAFALVALGMAELPLPGVDPMPYVPPPMAPFMTTGAAPFALWALAFIAFISGHAAVCRGLVATAGGIAALLTPLTWLTGLSRPPMFILATSIAFAILTCGGRVPTRRWARWRGALGTIAVTGLLAAGALTTGHWDYDGPPARLGDYYYRGVLRSELEHGPAVLTALLVLAVLVSLHREGWSGPAVIVLTPWALLIALATSYVAWPSAALALAAAASLPCAVVAAWVVARLFGVRVRVERVD